MWSWERGFTEKSEAEGKKTEKKDGNVIRTRRLIAFASSPALNLMHSDLFSFILLIFALLLLSQMWVCARAAPSWLDSGGNKADSRPDYSSLHWLCRIPPASLQPRPQNSEPCNRLPALHYGPSTWALICSGLTRSTIQYRNRKIIMSFIIPEAWAQIRLQPLVYYRGSVLLSSPQSRNMIPVQRSSSFWIPLVCINVAHRILALRNASLVPLCQLPAENFKGRGENSERKKRKKKKSSKQWESEKGGGTEFTPEIILPSLSALSKAEC